MSRKHSIKFALMWGDPHPHPHPYTELLKYQQSGAGEAISCAQEVVEKTSTGACLLISIAVHLTRAAMGVLDNNSVFPGISGHRLNRSVDSFFNGRIAI